MAVITMLRELRDENTYEVKIEDEWGNTVMPNNIPSTPRDLDLER